MSGGLMISVAGIRGIFGESLTPAIAARFAAAFARERGPGRIVVGRDARPSGPALLDAVAAGLAEAGREVVDLGIATTPTVAVAVPELAAAGGIILTASHNPAPWNALKFLSERGEFLDAEAGARVRTRFERDAGGSAPAGPPAPPARETRALEWHLERVLGLAVLDRAAIRGRRLRAVVDGCASAGGLAVPPLLRALGLEVDELDCVPNGVFRRELEPLPEHLGALSRAVVSAGADFGVAVDPDADRAAFVDAAGVPLGEEYTLALGLEVVLAVTPGPVVTNLSTSGIVDSVCAHAGVALHRAPVGEAHVVAAMRRLAAVAGGEGNGGMILPAAHYGRDGLVAAALIAQGLAPPGVTLRALADRLPRLEMLKEKLDRPDEPWERLAARLEARFAGYTLDTADGLRMSRGDEWLHVRPSGTEPVVRVIAESPTRGRTRALVDEARRALDGR